MHLFQKLSTMCCQYRHRGDTSANQSRIGNFTDIGHSLVDGHSTLYSVDYVIKDASNAT